ncbi:hypothetical protein [Lysinibacillus capsici]|uniref:hypothetical protein n=1 Tax=Lysinibacillus capsici TaxID=2115968 RepID=UPI002DBF02A9|nr:hypothetical protein [Lysinibacillus capsici]MEC1303060.1 hypothetical protein [Lysinibacillus capsici]
MKQKSYYPFSLFLKIIEFCPSISLKEYLFALMCNICKINNKSKYEVCNVRLKIVEEKLELGLRILLELIEFEDNINLVELKKRLEDLTSIIDEITREFPDLLPVHTFENDMIEINYKIYTIENDPFALLEDTKEFIKKVNRQLNELYNVLRDKKNVIKTLKHNNNLNDLSYVYAIGLPKYEYFDDLMDFTKNLNFVFKTIIGKEEKAKLVGFDVGSEWYLIGFDTYVAFSTFGVFVKECYKYLKRKKEDEERINGLAVDNEARKKLEEAMLVANQVFIQDGLNKLARLKNEGEELSHEEMSQNLKALEIFSGLLEQNMKVDVDKQPVETQDQPTLNLPSSDTIRNLLESSSMLFLDNNDENK